METLGQASGKHVSWDALSLRDARGIGAAVLVGLSVLFAYRDVLQILVRQWLTDDVYSYGFLIPLISIYMAWRCRHRLGAGPLEGAPVLGGVLLLGGLAALTAGRTLGVVDIQELSLLPTLAGLVAIIGGWTALRAFWFPILYLALMMPVWDIATDRLHYPFQQFSAAMATRMLHVLGVTVNRNGTYLYLPNITLEVARLCSGVNYLIGVTAISIPLAYLAFHDYLRRTILIGVALITAILANAFRVTLIGCLLFYGWTHEVHGPGHVLQGLFVAMIGYGALMLFLQLLLRWRRPANGDPFHSAAARSGEARGSGSLVRLWTSAAIVAAIMFLIGVAKPTAAAGSFSADAQLGALPDSLSGWHLVQEPWIAQDATGMSEPSRTYRSDRGTLVRVYMGSVMGGSTAGNRSLLVDAFTKQAKPVSLDAEIDSGVTINRSHGLFGSQRLALVLYWYDVQGRVIQDGVAAKLHTLRYRLLGGQRAPFVVIVVPLAPASADAALADAGSFARALMNVLAGSAPARAHSRPADSEPVEPVLASAARP